MTKEGRNDGVVSLPKFIFPSIIKSTRRLFKKLGKRKESTKLNEQRRSNSFASFPMSLAMLKMSTSSNSSDGFSSTSNSSAGLSKDFGSLRDYRILQKLNRGKFGRVILVRNDRQRQNYAVKLMSKCDSGFDSPRTTSMIEHEVKALQMCSDHPFIIGFYGLTKTASKFALIQEYAPYGDMAAYISKYGHLSENDARYYLAEIIVGVEFIHNQGIVHRDIKLENIVMDFQGHVKIIDFGESEFLSSDESLRDCVGTTEYMAPEILQGISYDFSVDYFSVGVCAYCMMTGRFPFGNRDGVRRKSVASVENSILFETPVYPMNLSMSARQVLIGLLWKNPKERLGCPYPNGMKHLKRHPFFVNTNWKNVAERKCGIPPVIELISRTKQVESQK